MPKRNTRTALLDAAERAALDVGLSRVTTKAVAERADCSEAAIYYHFADRTELLAQVVARRIGAAAEAVADRAAAGGTTLRVRLEKLIASLADSLVRLIPLSAPLLADPDVLHRFRSVLAEHDTGIGVMTDAVTKVVRDGQAAGLVRDDVDAAAAGYLIYAACHHAALEHHLHGSDSHPQTDIGSHLAATFETLLSS